uniref:Uncharacterized protein n=1 Tax=Trypanosoma congolense (strain IL3000) TaxID=1068625 RepID=G0UST7_TRYCI|nr:conserved hypothetical protein [Trypanosoma congolense IL3000]
MGTSSSTLDVGRILFGMASSTQVTDEDVRVLLSTSLSDEDLQNAFPFPMLRVIRHYYTNNFALLLFRCIEVVAKAVASCSDSANRSYVDVHTFLNALRVMRRILPVAMEGGDTPCGCIGGISGSSIDCTACETPFLPLFWESYPGGHRTTFTKTFVQSFFIDGYACSDVHPDERLPVLPGQDSPLGKFLTRLLLECCFIRGLGLEAFDDPVKSNGDASQDALCLWYSGVGGKGAIVSVGAVREITHVIRYELLATMTVLLSYPLFLPLGTPDIIFTEPVLCPANASLLIALVASTINAIISYVPYGILPYTSHWVGKEEGVVCMGACFLSSVISYASASLSESQCNSESTNLEVTEIGLHTKMGDSVINFIRTLSMEDATCIIRGLWPIIGLKLYGKQTCLPDSQRCFTTQSEFVMLLWRLIDLSPECLQAFGREAATLKYLLPLVDYALNAVRSPQYAPHLQLVLFILMRASELGNFCLLCNTPFLETIPFNFDAFVGSYNDLIILAMCSFMLMPHKFIRPHNAMCSAVISNVVPLMTTMSCATAERLCTVFSSVAARCVTYEKVRLALPAAAETPAVINDQAAMVNVVEAVVSAMKRRPSGVDELVGAFALQKGLIDDVAAVFGSAVMKGKEEHVTFRTPLSSPFMIEALLGAVERNTEDGLAAVAVDALGSDVNVRRVNFSKETDRWAFVTHWYSMCMSFPPGTFGDKKSIRALRFS